MKKLRSFRGRLGLEKGRPYLCSQDSFDVKIYATIGTLFCELVGEKQTQNTKCSGLLTSQWFRAQFGPILVYTKRQMFSFKMVFMLNLMLLLENYSPMMYFVPLKQQFCMPLSMLYFARPV